MISLRKKKSICERGVDNMSIYQSKGKKGMKEKQIRIKVATFVFSLRNKSQTQMLRECFKIKVII